MSDKSVVLFTVRKGERVQALTGTVITTKAGIARVTADTATIDYVDLGLQPPRSGETKQITAVRGDIVYLLTPQGEGFYTGWFHGMLLGQVNAIDLPRQLESGEEVAQGELVDDPVIVWWAKVRNRRGQVGWTRQTDDFGNMDSCGGPEQPVTVQRDDRFQTTSAPPR